MRPFIKILILLLSLLSSLVAYSECVEEFVIKGNKLKAKDLNNLNYTVEIDGRFLEANSVKDLLKDNQEYTVQVDVLHHHFNDKSIRGNFSDYNRTFLKYYTPKMLDIFLQKMQAKFSRDKYTLKVIGKSVKGRKLYALFPTKFSKEKKTIIMFGRHHGDEQTANWIIEGFVKDIFSDNQNIDWHQNYQLVLYPMINPDGAFYQTRYNANNRDLNRMWLDNFSEMVDEVAVVANHMAKLNIDYKKVPVVLDMHGSKKEDFIYRVEEDYFTPRYHLIQTSFISQLGIYDPWQAGVEIFSNGKPGMSRIVLAHKYGLNSLTHETIKNIPIKNDRNRQIGDLLKQGNAVYQTIIDLYQDV